MAPGDDARPEDDPAFVRRLFDATPDGLWLFDDRAVTIWANPRMARIVGREVDAMSGVSVHELFDEQGRRDFDDHLAEMLATGSGAENIEAYFVRPDGTAVWGLISYAPVLDDDGVRTGWLHRVTPYTERKELLEALVEREQQLATAQQLAHLGSWEWDVPGDRVLWSDEMCRIFGVATGTTPDFEAYLSLLHPGDRERAGQVIQRAAEEGSAAYEFDHRVLRPDGEVRWVRGRGVVERSADGTVIRMSGTAQDITDLHTADEQAEEATRRLFLLQQMTTAANLSTNLREALLIAGAGVPEHTTWSAVCGFLYDWQVAGVEVLDMSGGRAVVAPDPELAAEARRTAMVTIGVPSAMAETHSLVAMPVVLEGEVIAVVELMADELPPDENSHQLMAQISHQLALVAGRERTAAQLAEARDDAMEASRLKSEFLATMSHEIRTPMNGVIGLTDLLLRTDLDEHQRRLTANLQNAGMTLLGIINDILDLSKIEAGKLELEAADFDVRAVFDQVATVLSGPAHEKGLELIVACHPDVPVQLRGDSVRLGQVISNLGSNAVKFTDSGEVAIEARVERQTTHDVVLRVDVTDTGVGIDPTSRERLFDAFTQADPSTTRRHGGTGLGLAISRQLVDALGGELWLTSELGTGSTFSFTVRLDRVAGAAERQFDVPVQLRGRRILVVDDNETNRFILEDQLSAWHMRAYAVPSAADALRALREGVELGDPFELALLDLRMPDVDGLELARRIRSDRDLVGLHLLLLSSEQVPRQQVADAGIRTSLSKPVREVELHDALLGVLAPRPLGAARARTSGADAALGIRVLVVEDNPVNQMVATGLLENLGCVVDVADDGVAAVEMLAQPHEYAVVFMDCRMPRLDGFDATRRIRAQEPPGQRVPIVAMTASALEGERERCLEAGMDDYLTKPVNAREVERALHTWAELPDPVDPAAGAVAAPEAAPAPAPPAPPPAAGAGAVGVLDADRVQVLEGLVKDGTSFFERTAASFMGRVGDQLVAIRAAVDGDNANSLLTSAHQLKGSALNLGLPRVATAAARLEALGIAGRTDGAQPMLDELSAEVLVAVSALQQATAKDH
ncbi:response regulator [Nocardioides conyzicola]|uniref:histidine kinase n=1 Tax=Nocardioides conyzicola TaxID=1651781 RepID=A0ABP8XKX2_9ACTN